VNSKATQHSDEQEIWNMEVINHAKKWTYICLVNGDIKKLCKWNLIGILRNHFNCNIKLATKIKVFCTQVIGK
jgi:hypothetical protein